MSTYTLRSIDSSHSLNNSHSQLIRNQSTYLISNPEQCNISATNSLSQWNKSRLSNSIEKNRFADLQSISQSIPNFNSFFQTLSNMKSNRSLEEDFIENHIQAYYEALYSYTDSIDSEKNCYLKIKSFVNSKLYTGMTYQPKKLTILVKECGFLTNDQKQSLLEQLKKQKSIKQFLQKILSQQSLEVSYELLICLKVILRQHAIRSDCFFQTQLKQNCSKIAKIIVQENWQILYYHQNIKFINMRKVSINNVKSEQLCQLFTSFLLKFTETIFFILQGFFNRNLYDTININKQNIPNYNKGIQKQLINKIQLKRSFKSFKLISSSLDMVQSQQSDEEECLFRRKPRKKTKIQKVQLSSNYSNTSMEFTF